MNEFQFVAAASVAGLIYFFVLVATRKEEIKSLEHATFITRTIDK